MTISLRDVTFGYDRSEKPVLSGLNTRAVAGDAVALVGANGSGKTTLTRLLVALEQPWAGEVVVAGRSTAGLEPSDLADSVAYVFQHPARQLFARSVIGEVAFAPRELGRGQAEALGLAHDALALVGLESLADVHPHDLPPGAQKLVALAAALAQGPAVMVLDEPTQGLDRDTLLRVAGVVRAKAADGMTILAVTHDLTFVAEALDVMWVMGEGRLVAEERAVDLLGDPARCRELGLRAPPVAELATRMGWGPGHYRMEVAARAAASPP